jgi:hypothetical protein
MDLQEGGWGGIDCISVVKDRGRWRGFVNAVMNFRFHKMREISGLPEELLASLEGLCSKEVVSVVHLVREMFNIELDF